mmetsp:Transcript_13569/g.27760  ORF Transcript_13569/g.27760 Transcript_13569/m.27760 type:complete len:347 (-) Transcript_13569:810-1850(-)
MRRVLLRLDAKVPPPRPPPLLVLREHPDVAGDAALHLHGRGARGRLGSLSGVHERPGRLLGEALVRQRLLGLADGGGAARPVVAAGLEAAALAPRRGSPRRPGAEGRWCRRSRLLDRLRHLHHPKPGVLVVQNELVSHPEVPEELGQLHLLLVRTPGRSLDEFPRDSWEPEGAHLLHDVVVDGPVLLLHELGGVAEVWRQLVLEPGVEPDLRDSYSLHGVNLEHPRDEVSSELGEVRGERVHAALDLLEEVGDGLVVEGKRPAEESVEDDAAAPHVHLRAGVKVPRDDLRCSVVGRPAGRPQEVPVPHHVAQAKVRYLEVEVVVQEEVLWLEVPVDDLLEVAVLHA